MSYKALITVVVVSIVALIASACGTEDEAPVITPIQVPTPLIADTPAPRPAPTPTIEIALESTATPTPLPDPTPIPTPTSTLTPSPEATVTARPKETSRAEESIDGRWEGTVVLLGTIHLVVVQFETDEQGLTATIDLPSLGATGVVLTNVSFVFPEIHFESEDLAAVFNGELKDGAIEGRFSVQGLSGPLRLERA